MGEALSCWVLARRPRFDTEAVYVRYVVNSLIRTGSSPDTSFSSVNITLLSEGHAGDTLEPSYK